MVYYILSLLLIILLTGVWFYKRKLNTRINYSNELLDDDTGTFISEKELWNIQEIDNENNLSPQHYTQLNPSKKLSNNVLTLLKQVPQKTSNFVNKQEKTYLLTFSEKTTQAIKEKKLDLMQVKDNLGSVRANVVNKKGAVVEQGALKQTKMRKVNPTQVAMGVLTAVAAQEHLEQIDKQLKKLNIGVNKIISAMDNKQIGNDKGNIDYLKTIYSDLDQGDTSSESILNYRNQLETIIRTTMQDLSTVQEGFSDFINQLESEKLKGFLSANKETNNIKAIVDDFDKQSNIYLSKLDVILVCLSLSKYLNPNYSADVSRLEYVQKKLLGLRETKDLFFKEVEEIIPDIGARIRYNKGKYNLNLQESIEKQSLALQNYFDDSKEEFEVRIEKTKYGEFFDNIFEHGFAEYEITVDDNQEIKTLRKKKVQNN